MGPFPRFCVMYFHVQNRDQEKKNKSKNKTRQLKMATEKVTSILLQNLDENTNTKLKSRARYIFVSLFLSLKEVCSSKIIKICQNQLAQLLRFLCVEDSWKIKNTSFQATVFIKCFDKKFYSLLHKLAKFYYQTLFTLQVIQVNNVFHVSGLGIWWGHDIWISEKLKFDYLKNRKSFQPEIKNNCPCFTSAVF